MRVSGGTGRGRKLKTPGGSRVRPTSDKVKQALFNILGDRSEGAVFLDLFAGAGGIVYRSSTAHPGPGLGALRMIKSRARTWFPAK